MELSPAGLLWAVPWLAVPVAGQLLVKTLTLTLIPSGRCASQLARLDFEPILRPIGYFDHTLAGAALEQSAIERLWGGVDQLTSYADRRFASHGMLVAATHGNYGAGGLTQTLHLAGQDVTAAELFTWSFPRLTVLGACWLGRVDTSLGGDPLGVTIPVLANGARTLIAGLFGIHDESTGTILARTYELIAHGEHSPTAALRQSQLERIGQSADPISDLYSWAGLVAIGGS